MSTCQAAGPSAAHRRAPQGSAWPHSPPVRHRASAPHAAHVCGRAARPRRAVQQCLDLIAAGKWKHDLHGSGGAIKKKGGRGGTTGRGRGGGGGRGTGRGGGRQTTGGRGGGRQQNTRNSGQNTRNGGGGGGRGVKVSPHATRRL